MLHTGNMMAMLTCASIATSQSNISVQVTEMLDLLTEELLASPNIDTRLSAFEYAMEKDKKIKFFRAYFEAFEFLRLEGRCSSNHRTQTVECLVKFPHAKVFAYGNLEGASRPLIQFVATLEDLIYVLELTGKHVMSLSKFFAATDPHIDFVYKRNPFQKKWEKKIHPKLMEWIQSNFMRLVDWYVKPKLSTLAARYKFL